MVRLPIRRADSFIWQILIGKKIYIIGNGKSGKIYMTN
jgi:hypothetical protein